MAIVITRTLTPPFAVQLSWRFGTLPGDQQDHRLANLVIIALGTDRRALPDDVLPDPRSTDRRGWWGDTEAPTVWGAKAPIGTRLWLLVRAKMTGSGAREGAVLTRAKTYIAEALQPLVDMKIATRFDTELQQVGADQIFGTITIYRGPKTAIALAFQDLWRDFGG